MSHKTLRAMLLAALFAALTAVGAFIRVPIGPTSITLQFFFSALAGILLGVKWGVFSQVLYVGLGLLGFPIFTMGGGLSYLVQPSFGFLLGLIPSTAVIGALTHRHTERPRLFLGCLLGDLVLYLFGVPYMYMILHLYTGSETTWVAMWASMLVYVPGDLIKLAVLTAAGPVLQRRLIKYNQ